MNATTELIRDGFLQIPQHVIEKFENQINTKQKSRPLEIFLSELIEKPYQSVHFQSPTLCSRFLKLLQKTTLSNKQQIRVLTFFREKSGLPQDLFENDVILTGNVDNAAVHCSKHLLETYFVFFKTAFSHGLKENIPNEGGKHLFGVLLGQKALDCFKQYILTEKICSDDKEALIELFQFAELINDTPFREACDEAIYSYLSDNKNRMDFDPSLITDKSNFIKCYLKIQNIKYTTLDNGKYCINLSCFSKLFNQEKDLEILKLISHEIDKVMIDVDEQNFYILNLIPKQYRKSILSIGFIQNIGDSPLKILKKLMDIFPNAIENNLSIDSIEEAIKVDENDDFAHAWLGYVLSLQGQLEEAKKSLQTAIALNPKSVFAHESLGDVLRQQGQWEEAKKSLQTAIALNPKFAFAHESLGDVLIQQDQLEEAKKSLQTAIALNPKSAFAHESLCDVLRRQGQLEEAKKSLQTAIKLNPKSVFAHKSLGDVLILQGQLEEAKKSFETAIALNPESASAHAKLGDVLRLQDQLEEAKKSLQIAIELDPEFAFAHKILGNVLRRQGQLEEAKKSIQIAIELNPKSAFAHEILGDVLRRQGQLEEAKKNFQTAIKLDPKSSFAHAWLGDVLKQQGQFEEAKESLQIAIELAPEDAIIHVLFSSLFKQQNQLEESEKSLQTAIKLTLKEAYWSEQFIDVLKQQGQLEEAKKIVQATDGINTENSVVQALIDGMLKLQLEETK